MNTFYDMLTESSVMLERALFVREDKVKEFSKTIEEKKTARLAMKEKVKAVRSVSALVELLDDEGITISTDSVVYSEDHDVMSYLKTDTRVRIFGCWFDGNHLVIEVDYDTNHGLFSSKLKCGLAKSTSLGQVEVYQDAVDILKKEIKELRVASVITAEKQG